MSQVTKVGSAVTVLAGVGLFTLLGLWVSPASVHALPTGLYELGSHPGGNANPPPYGLRLDELYNVTAGTDKFTFDFDHASSNMMLNYNGSSIHIFGDTYGGRDINSTYAADAHQGVYSVNFLYNMNVANLPGDGGGVQDVWVTGNGTNFGTIMTPLGDTFNLADKSNGTFTFQLGDEGGGGHRGHPGTSGWGWLYVDGVRSYTQDWLFTAKAVPIPGTAVLFLLGAVGMGMVKGRRVVQG